MEMARAEREEFAALLEELTPQQWDGPTLCEKWRVRDVVAHVIGYDPLSRPQLMRRMAKGLVTHGGANAVGVGRPTFGVCRRSDSRASSACSTF